MDRLDVYQQSLPVEGAPPATSQSLPVAMPTQQPAPDEPSTSAAPPSMLEHMINRLTGTGGEERYQTWPEKTVREALSAAHDAMNSKEPLTSQDLIQPAMAMSAVAGTGGVGGADATLGSAPFLRPALKYEGKIYKAPVGGQHLDAIPADVYPKFQKMAMNGEDINHFNFGFMNHKGQFLDREKALDYAIKEGLLDPNSEAARANTLTSTLMADSSKPGVAVQLLKSESGDGRFHIMDNGGNELGRLAISKRNNGKDLFIDNVNANSGANSLGYSSTKNILDQLKELHPEAERIGGYRTSGARSKSEEVWTNLGD